MKRAIFFSLIVICSLNGFAQDNSGKWAVAFPITSYIIKSNDSLVIVQVQLSDAWSLEEKQLGILKPMYRIKPDTSLYGWGRCQLIKGDYYYFGIHLTDKNKVPQEGDLIYVMMKKDSSLKGRVPSIAAHGITLQNVYEQDLYDRWKVLKNWSAADENSFMDSAMHDISFTAGSMKMQSPGQDRKLQKGIYKDQFLFDVMMKATRKDLSAFFEYLLAKPYIYAGNKWKLSEIYATWMDAGAPGL